MSPEIGLTHGTKNLEHQGDQSRTLTVYRHIHNTACNHKPDRGAAGLSQATGGERCGDTSRGRVEVVLVCVVAEPLFPPSSRLTHWASRSNLSSVIDFFPISKSDSLSGHLPPEDNRAAPNPQIGTEPGDRRAGNRRHVCVVSKEPPKFLNSFNRPRTRLFWRARAPFRTHRRTAGCWPALSPGRVTRPDFEPKVHLLGEPTGTAIDGS